MSDSPEAKSLSVSDIDKAQVKCKYNEDKDKILIWSIRVSHTQSGATSSLVISVPPIGWFRSRARHVRGSSAPIGRAVT